MLQLPKAAMLRPDQVAEYFQVSTRCVYLWVEHGHLEAVKVGGTVRIKRTSVLKCRFKAVDEEV